MELYKYVPCKPDCFICASKIEDILEWHLEEIIKLQKIMLHSLQDFFIVNNLITHYIRMEIVFFEIRNGMYYLNHVEDYIDDNTIYI